MLKKSLLILFIFFCIICISNICFANNTANNIKNGVGSVTNTIVDGAKNLATDVRNGVGAVENGCEGALTMDDMNTRNDDNDNNNNNTATTNNGDYTATRTATTRDATGAFGMDTSTTWVWIIVALASIVIVGLVWYYGTQNRVD